MRKILFNLKWIYIIALMILFFSNCSNWVKMGVTSSSQYSLIPTEGLTSSNIPNEQFFYINLKSSYYVGKGFDPLDAIIYSMEDGPGTDCKIPVSEESSEDLYCIMDIMEGDLWLNELVLEYNIPQGMCDYFSFRVPWHFNQLIGNGPKHVYEIEKFKIGGFEGEGEDKTAKVETRYCLGTTNPLNGTVLLPGVTIPGIGSGFPEDTCGAVPSANVKTYNDTINAAKKTYDEATNAAKETYDEAIKKAEEEEEEEEAKITTEEANTAYDKAKEDATTAYDIIYDFATGIYRRASAGKRPGPAKDIKEFCGDLDKSESDLANCCLGTYTLHKAGGETEKSEWGGNFGECIGGLARISKVADPTSEGVPRGKITQVKGDGLREEYEIPALINIYDGHLKNGELSAGNKPSFITANYWESVREKDFKSTKPQIYETPLELSSVPDSFNYEEQTEYKYSITRIPPYPYLTWTCLDRAREIKHRINLVIREWNTQEEYNLFKDSEGGSGDPNIVGTEGNDCEYYESNEGYLLSDTGCNDLDSVDDFESGGLDYPNIIYKK